MRKQINFALIVALILAIISTALEVYRAANDVFYNEQGLVWQRVFETFFMWFMPLAVTMAIGAALAYGIVKLGKKRK
ncbi:hypothetical protein [Thalassotalea maritima]|uniref:hypothetical protein n=1 Tax=Thalassotalea maritima TaxID=3242416 RepID=UPI0035275D7A